MQAAMKLMVIGICGFIAACAQEPAGPWQLDNAQSQLSFVSTKAVDVSEVHRFSELSGAVAEDGAAEITIELASIDSLIAVRDERMRQMLFETELFPRATVTAQLDIGKYTAMQAGDSLVTTEQLLLDLHGVSAGVSAEVLATKVSAERFVVASLRPVIVNAAAFELAAGVEQLREVAGLPSIGGSVPVSFVLTFTRSP